MTASLVLYGLGCFALGIATAFVLDAIADHVARGVEDSR